MRENNYINDISEIIQKSMELSKCRKCGCMKDTLETMMNELLKTKNDDFSEILNEVENSIKKMETIKYN